MSAVPLKRVHSTFSTQSSVRIPLFLAPAFAHIPSSSPIAPQCRLFASSPSLQLGKKRSREKNKNRGVSAIRRTGPRVALSVEKFPLPRPVLNSAKRAEFKPDEDHGLWGFFKNRAAMISPEEEDAHGRPWTYQELDYKSWEDLHALYWICLKERNQIYTRTKERRRLQAGYGDFESDARLEAVQKTMSTIKELLLNRFNLREDARALVAKQHIGPLLKEHEEKIVREREEKAKSEELP